MLAATCSESGRPRLGTVRHLAGRSTVSAGRGSGSQLNSSQVVMSRFLRWQLNGGRTLRWPGIPALALLAPFSVVPLVSRASGEILAHQSERSAIQLDDSGGDDLLTEEHVMMSLCLARMFHNSD